MAYTYDVLNRPVSSVLYKTVSGQETAVLHQYHYDGLGRVDEVRGKDGAYVARYQYLDWGPLCSVRLGGTAQANTGLLVEYQYHVQGWVKEIKATQLSTGHEVFRQDLGYETKALAESGVPEPIQAKFGGQIAQQLYKFTTDVEDPVRLMNYQYDALGRMRGADYRKNATPNPLDANQNLLFPLSLVDDADLDASLDYDLNGRITGKRSGGVASVDSAVYAYNPDSYTLDHVTGKITAGGTRDLSASGTLDYDIRGALVEDHSKHLKIRYGWDLMPTRFDLAQESGQTVSQLQFYDASGTRVSSVTVTRLTSGLPNALVGAAEAGEASDLYDYAEVRAAYSQAQAQLDALPESELPDTVRFYVVPLAGADEVEPAEGDIEAITTHGRQIPLELIGVLKFSPDYYSLLQSRNGGKRIVASHHLQYGGMDVREIQEAYDSEGALSVSDTVEGLFGRGAKIGRVLPGGAFQFYVKNHQGSTMRTVNADGGYAAGSVFDYGSYGELKQVKENADITPTEKWTGKEYVEALRLYDFGARHLDPELGIWTTPDAAGQYFNPYSYGAGDPINGTDPDGNWFWIDDAIATGLGAVAGYVGYGVATGDWWSGQALAMAAVGAAAGEGALYTGGATLSALGAVGVTGVGATVAAGAAGGAVAGAISGVGGYSVGAAAGDHSWDLGDAAKATTLGVASGAVGGAVGGVAAVGAGALASQLGAQSPVLAGAVGGAAGGYAGGAVATLATGGSLAEANRQGLMGMAQGAAAGAVTGYVYSKASSIDPWTGKSTETPQVPVADPRAPAVIQDDPTIQTQRPEIVLPDKGASSSIRQYTMNGGNAEALRQFNSLPLRNVQPTANGGFYGQMPNGVTVTYYPASTSGGLPTIVMRGVGKTVKVRFTP
jgi:RHS repeat-associated protein